ncbi:CHAT domain-containing protein [Ephemerocybe angulata]|uniref:CHAT domain-containing protein n=1 Tax=Ephemerocybe angulata TaxID=980116 RepID=A0A8H6HHV6_9AGAR|nr:CHAT domain-containing protein [Tulosesus angulatus]
MNSHQGFDTAAYMALQDKGDRNLYLLKNSGDSNRLEDAITAYWEALSLIPSVDPDAHALRIILTEAIFYRQERTKDIGDLDAIADIWDSAIAARGGCSRVAAKAYELLGWTFLVRFEKYGMVLTNLDTSIAYLQRAISTAYMPRRSSDRMEHGGVDLALCYSNLSTALHLRFSHGEARDSNDIENAIMHASKAICHTPEAHDRRERRLAELGKLYCARFMMSNDHRREDINTALFWQTKALKECNQKTPYRPECLHNLSFSYNQLFLHTGENAFLEAAIRHSVEAAGLHTAGPHIFAGLGKLYCTLSNARGTIEDLDRGITFLERSSQMVELELVAKSGSGVPDWETVQSMGLAYHRRFKLGGHYDDLEKSIKNIEAAQASLPEHVDGVDRANLLSTLGNALISKFHLSGEKYDLEKAVLSHREAARMIPLAFNSQTVGILHDFSRALLTQFEWGRREEPVITEAVAYARLAIAQLDPTHHLLPILNATLAEALAARYDSGGSPVDIDGSIKASNAAIERTSSSSSDPRYHSFRNILATSLLHRFTRFNKECDLNRAIVILRGVVQGTPMDNANRLSFASHLAAALQTRFESSSSKTTVDLDECITALEEFGDLPNEPNVMSRLGYVYLLRSRDDDDRRNGHKCYRLAALASAGSAFIRFRAAGAWANLSSSPENLEAFERAIELIAQMVGLEHPIERRHDILGVDLLEVPLSAAAAAFSSGNIGKAIEWLEQGRGLVWSQLRALRSPLKNLEDVDLQLADEVRRVSNELDRMGTKERRAGTGDTMEERIIAQREGARQAELAKDWDRLVRTVRCMPGFEDFLEPPRFQRLRKTLPQSGYVVVINASRRTMPLDSFDRCDAAIFVPGNEELIHIHLEAFSPEKAKKLQDELHSLLRESGLIHRGNSGDPTWFGAVTRALKPLTGKGRSVSLHSTRVCRILADLWNYLAKPIVDVLDLKRSDSPTRIWWCLTGALSTLPIHAAGIYGDSYPVSMMDYAVSSYISSLSSFALFASQGQVESKNQNSLLVLSQPNSPGRNPIPGATREAKLVRQAASDGGVLTSEIQSADSSTEGVRRAMTHFNCVHFACHASQDPTAPLKSGFHLENGDTLTLSSIMGLNLGSRDLAFLSACQTSTGDEKLSEESVHLAAAMLACGYRSVVATMWSIHDETAPELAESFYKYLLEGSRKGGVHSQVDGDGSRSAMALHSAITNLRRSTGDSVSSLLDWVPYVHFGT